LRDIQLDYDFFAPPVDEQIFYLVDAKKVLKHIDNRASYWTLRDCAQFGRKDCRQKRIRLRVCVLPSGMGTTVEEFIRFRERLNSRNGR